MQKVYPLEVTFTQTPRPLHSLFPAESSTAFPDDDASTDVDVLGDISFIQNGNAVSARKT